MHSNLLVPEIHLACNRAFCRLAHLLVVGKPCPLLMEPWYRMASRLYSFAQQTSGKRNHVLEYAPEN